MRKLFMMPGKSISIILLVGLIVVSFAGNVLRGTGLGVPGNIAVGILGIFAVTMIVLG